MKKTGPNHLDMIDMPLIGSWTTGNAPICKFLLTNFG